MNFLVVATVNIKPPFSPSAPLSRLPTATMPTRGTIMTRNGANRPRRIATSRMRARARSPDRARANNIARADESDDVCDARSNAPLPLSPVYFLIDQRPSLSSWIYLAIASRSPVGSPRSSILAHVEIFRDFSSVRRRGGERGGGEPTCGGARAAAFFVFTRVLLCARRDGAMKGPARTKSTKAISNRSNGRRDFGTAGSLSLLPPRLSTLNEIRCCLSRAESSRARACLYCRNNDDRSRRSGDGKREGGEGEEDEKDSAAYRSLINRASARYERWQIKRNESDRSSLGFVDEFSPRVESVTTIAYETRNATAAGSRNEIGNRQRSFAAART